MQNAPEHYSSEHLNELCEHLRRAADARSGCSQSMWPGDELKACAEAGVFRWFLSREQGGWQWDAADQTRGYLRLAQADLTTTFVITQMVGSIKRIAGSAPSPACDRWLDRLCSGDAMGTVGISHLTTSRQHLARPVLSAIETDDGYTLDGFSYWVTGAADADVIVVGATCEDGREILVAVPTDAPGLKTGTGVNLIALSGSCTDQVQFDNVRVDRSTLIAGPIVDVLSAGVGGGAGGLQTSTLAIGLARAASKFLTTQAQSRANLREPAERLMRELDEAEATLLAMAAGEGDGQVSEMRTLANDLARRTTSAAMTAAKGAGFVEGHPVGRWCREALFFLVWSCPEPVAQAHLCEMAGLAK